MRRGQLDQKLSEAEQYNFKSLSELDQPINDLKKQSETAATDEKYDEALTSVGDLSTKVDEKIQKGKELEEKKKQYEEARGQLDPKLTEASQCQFKSLAEFDQKIADLTSKTDAAAGEEKYDEALQLVGELTTAVDEKLAKSKELEAAKAAYEAARAKLDPDLAKASTCKHEELAKMDEEIADLVGQDGSSRRRGRLQNRQRDCRPVNWESCDKALGRKSDRSQDCRLGSKGTSRQETGIIG